MPFLRVFLPMLAAGYGQLGHRQLAKVPVRKQTTSLAQRVPNSAFVRMFSTDVASDSSFLDITPPDKTVIKRSS